MAKFFENRSNSIWVVSHKCILNCVFMGCNPYGSVQNPIYLTEVQVKEYIATHERLAEVGKKLGEMKQGTTYAQFMTMANQSGVSNPQLMLAMTWKKSQTAFLDIPEGAQTVYPIADFEWNDFVSDIPTYMKVNPEVWVVDGSRFTAPI